MLTLCCKLFSATLVLPLPSVCLIWWSNALSNRATAGSLADVNITANIKSPEHWAALFVVPYSTLLNPSERQPSPTPDLRGQGKFWVFRSKSRGLGSGVLTMDPAAGARSCYCADPGCWAIKGPINSLQAKGLPQRWGLGSVLQSHVAWPGTDPLLLGSSHGKTVSQSSFPCHSPP